MIIPDWMLLRIRNVPDKSCGANKNAFYEQINYFLKIIPFVRYCGKTDRPQMAIWCCAEKHALCVWDNNSENRDRRTLAVFHTHCCNILLIPSDLVQRFVATVTQTDRLPNHLAVITIRLAEMCIWIRPQTNILLFHCSMWHFAGRPAYVVLL
jgi:hypothetical protein